MIQRIRESLVPGRWYTVDEVVPFVHEEISAKRALTRYRHWSKNNSHADERPLDIQIAIGHRCVVADALYAAFRQGNLERDKQNGIRVYRKKAND